jgi:hypothetical protein
VRLEFRRDILPFLIATVGEFVALYWWLGYHDAGKATLAKVVLWAGFAIERVAVAWWVRFVFTTDTNGQPTSLWLTGVFLAVITLIEVGIWELWLVASRSYSPLVGFVVLFATIHILHFGEMAVVRRVPVFTFALSVRTAFFSLMEAAAGFGWIYFWDSGHHVWGGVMLAIGLTVEHLVQGGQLKPEKPAG